MGRKISTDELSDEINKQIEISKIPINPNVVKSCVGKLLKQGKHKSVIAPNNIHAQKQDEFPGAPHIAIGCVCLVCAVLVGTIGYAVPPLSHHCTQVAYTLFGLGTGCIINGLTQEENRKRLV